MCGIGGIYALHSGGIQEEELNGLSRMKNFMLNRGPDASGMMQRGKIAFVHTRLSIIDLDARSNQPMESGNWVLTYNGEIVNFKEIREQLKQNYTFKTSSDTEVLLYALEEWGLVKTLEKCAGMFAFLAYDKAKKSLFAVRDRLGIKPLFVHRHQNDVYWLASTPAAITAALPANEWKIYKPALGSFFAFGAPFTRSSSIDDIEQIPPAHYAEITPDGLYKLHRYWKPQFQENFTLDDMINIIAEYKISDVKSALFLSGGIDSTFLASILGEIDFFHLDSMEKCYANLVAEKYKRELTVVKPSAIDYIEGIKKTCITYGEPLMSSGIPAVVAAEAVCHGYKMAISANGADELFLGYPRTPLLEFSGKLPSHEEQSVKWFSSQISHIFREKRHFSIKEYDNFIPSLLDISYSVIKSSILDNFPASSSYRWLELITYVQNDLNPTLDAASMANSLEVRVPFLDHRIVQGVLSWSENRICNTKFGRKAPLKQFLSKDFSDDFLNRPKLGFSIDQNVLREIANEVDASFKTMQSSGFITINLSERKQNFERDILYLKASCFMYSLWKETFVDKLASMKTFQARKNYLASEIG